MCLLEIRAFTLCFFIFLSGCEIRRVDSVSAYAETLDIPESDITDPEVLTVSPNSNSISSKDNKNSFWGLLGIEVSTPDQEEEYIFSSEELRGLSELDVRLYSRKNVIANDLINNEGNHAASCRGTDFRDVLSFQNTIEVANQSSRLTIAEEKQQWKDAIKDAEIADVPDFSPPPDIEDPLFLRERDYLLSVEENFASFRVTRIQPRHFQYIELTSLEARNAQLVVDAMGRVTANDNAGTVYYAHRIQLTYYFTQGGNSEWRCAHLHATYNPININIKFKSDYEACDNVGKSLFRSRTKNQKRCRQAVINKYEKLELQTTAEVD